jgi:hypothetical protein
MLVIASIGSAFASPVSDAAQIHFNAIGAGDTSIIMRSYGENPQLTWVGGPLDGMYAGDDAIRITWEKFAKEVGPARVTWAWWTRWKSRCSSSSPRLFIACTPLAKLHLWPVSRPIRWE